MDLRVLSLALVLFVAYAQAEDEVKTSVKPEDLECHVCNGMTDNECNDPFGSPAENGDLVEHTKFKKKCSELGLPKPATMCRKIYQDVRGVVRIIRSCAWEEYDKKGETKFEQQNNCYKTVMEEYNTYVCTCNDESFCNGASLTQVSALLFAILPVVTMGLFR